MKRNSDGERKRPKLELSREAKRYIQRKGVNRRIISHFGFRNEKLVIFPGKLRVAEILNLKNEKKPLEEVNLINQSKVEIYDKI